MIRLIGKLVRDARGATAVEYGFIIGLIVIAIVSGVSSLGGTTMSMWSNMAGRVAAVEQ